MQYYTQLTKEEKRNSGRITFNTCARAVFHRKNTVRKIRYHTGILKTWCANVKQGAEPLTRKFVKLQPEKISRGNAGKIGITFGSPIVVCVKETISEAHRTKIF